MTNTAHATRTTTLHDTFSADGADEPVAIHHITPACGFVLHGAPVEATGTSIDCRFCIGGDDLRQLGRPSALDRILPGGDTERFEGNYKAPATGKADGPSKSYDERLAETIAWLLDLGRKVEVMDVTHANKRVAGEWLHRYDGDFAFLTDVRGRGGVKSDGQAKGVLNCIRAQAIRDARPATTASPAAPVVEVAARVTITAGPTPDVPAGHYAVENEDGVLRFYEVDRPTEGRWAGRTFVSVQASDERHPVRGAAGVAVLTKIAVDAKAAMIRYGMEIGRCGHCNRTLTDEASRAAGIGPVCASKMAW
jgi:hypothetical protein